jgi:hypothetical protein
MCDDVTFILVGHKRTSSNGIPDHRYGLRIGVLEAQTVLQLKRVPPENPRHRPSVHRKLGRGVRNVTRMGACNDQLPIPNSSAFPLRPSNISHRTSTIELKYSLANAVARRRRPKSAYRGTRTLQASRVPALSAHCWAT